MDDQAQALEDDVQVSAIAAQAPETNSTASDVERPHDSAAPIVVVKTEAPEFIVPSSANTADNPIVIEDDDDQDDPKDDHEDDDVVITSVEQTMSDDRSTSQEGPRSSFPITTTILPSRRAVQVVQDQARNALALKALRENRDATRQLPSASESLFVEEEQDTTVDAARRSKRDEDDHKRLCTQWKKTERAYMKKIASLKGCQKKERFELEVRLVRAEQDEAARVARWQQEARAEHTADSEVALVSPTPEHSRRAAKRPRTIEDDNDGIDEHADQKRRMLIKRAQMREDPFDSSGTDEDEEVTEIASTSVTRGKGKKRNAPTSSRSKKGTSNARTGVKSAALQSTRSRPSQSHNTSNIKSLAGSDMWSAAAANEGLEAQPQFLNSTSRVGALKELLASIPEEHRKIGQTDRKALDDAARKFTRKSCRVAPGRDKEESGWMITGMKSKLKHFQLLGTAFMRDRENDSCGPFGGLHADNMGFGKTVMQLANIVEGLRVIDRNKDPKTTLIVASPALVTQWHNEIHKHCDMDYIGHMMALDSISGIVTEHMIREFKSYEIILATYNQVRKSYPVREAPVECQTAEEKQAWVDQFIEENKGILHCIDFQRIVLDEAQAIKNRDSKTSLACRALRGKYRWAITGTPILNSTEELYPYFDFLRVPNTGTFGIFKNNFISDKNNDNLPRLQQILGRFLLRRVHSDRLFNCPLVKLPKMNQHIFWTEFSSVERVIYEKVRKRMIDRINQYSRRDELQARYQNIFLLLLRLRQLTGHILSTEETLTDLLELQDLEQLRDLVGTEENSPNVLPERRLQLKQLRTRLVDLAEGKQPQETLSKRKDVRDNTQRTWRDAGASTTPIDVEDPHVDVQPILDLSTGGEHGVNYHYTKYLKQLGRADRFKTLQERQLCVMCNCRPVDPWILSCFHVLCNACLSVLHTSAAGTGRASCLCPECGTRIDKAEPLKPWEEETIFSDEEDEEDEMSGKRKRNRKKKRGGRRGGNDDETTRKFEFISNIPSAKTLAVKAQILNWFEGDPEGKIIVYSQFLMMIDLLGRMCMSEGWQHLEVAFASFADKLQYHGAMSQEARTKALHDFEKKDGPKILLASLKAGGTGLNLTMANKVIIVDMWFNYGIEDQAFCRVYRIGQERESSLLRVAVCNTIDEDLINMQEAKSEEVKAVMEGTVARRSRLSVRELMALFGTVEDDASGRPFILVGGNRAGHVTAADLDGGEEAVEA